MNWTIPMQYTLNNIKICSPNFYLKQRKCFAIIKHNLHKTLDLLFIKAACRSLQHHLYCYILSPKWQLKRCLWCNGYHLRKRTELPKFKPWSRLFVFQVALVLVGKNIHSSFSLNRSQNSRAPFSFNLFLWQPVWEKKSFAFKPVNLHTKLTLCCLWLARWGSINAYICAN